MCGKPLEPIRLPAVLVDMYRYTEQRQVTTMPGIRSNPQKQASGLLSSWVTSYSRRQQFRRMAKSLLAEKDDILADLGYERRDLQGALKLPLRSDAVEYLETHRFK